MTAERIDLGDRLYAGPVQTRHEGDFVYRYHLVYKDGDPPQELGPVAEHMIRGWTGTRPSASFTKPIPYARCTICTSPLDMPSRPWSRSRGGDCIVCMADAGDPDCVEIVEAMRAGARPPTHFNPGARFQYRHVSESEFDALRDALPAEKGEVNANQDRTI